MLNKFGIFFCKYLIAFVNFLKKKDVHFNHMLDNNNTSRLKSHLDVKVT